jgi:hypothetical protein
MKDFFLKIVKNTGVRKAFLARVVALAAALGLSASTGCAALQARPEYAQAACVADVLADGGDPEALTLGQARELAAALKACKSPAPVGDAGTE